MTTAEPTFRNLVTSFTDFLTVAIHTILYERSIYPRTSFLSSRKYNFAVRQNRHPKVCEWINDAVAAVEAELLKCTVERIAIIIYNEENKPLERFMFDVSHFPSVAPSEIDTVLEQSGPDGEKVAVLPTVDIQEQFRATMSKLSNCAAVLKPLPKGCTFTVAIELKAEGEAPIGHPQPWMPVEARKENTLLRPASTSMRPVRAVSAGEMIFESWVEQAKD